MAPSSSTVFSRSPPPLDLTSTASASAGRHRVAYYYDPDVGNYVYYLGHPMKPHRIRMAHNLIMNYGLAEVWDKSNLATLSEDRHIGMGWGDDAAEAGPSRLGGIQPGSEATMGAGGTLTRPKSRDAEEAQMDIDAEVRARDTGGGEGDQAARKWEDGRRIMQVFRPRRATKGDMTRFHSDEYVEFLERVTPETAEALTGGGVRCLIGEDCPPFEGLFEFCSISAGGSIAAAERLNSGAADIAINWAGGLHHAKKTEASGFCYINDIVLGILELLRIHPRVLYIDVDVHHGDGVEEAFYTTDRVMTASFHRFGEFFPGTGDVRDIGMKRGRGYAVNVPLRDGITDGAFHSIFKPVISKIMEVFRPGAVVLQMGADSLSGDKLGGFNLTLQGHGECAAYLKTFGVPIMMLGGGGYTTKNVARAWTNETAVMCGKELPEDLPYNQYMEYYGPRYKLEVLANNTDNHNPPEYLEAIKRQVLENLRDLVHVPSVQMHAVPTQSVGDAMGLGRAVKTGPGGMPDEDEIDVRIREFMKRRNNASYATDSEDSGDERPKDSASARRRFINGSGGRKTVPRGGRGSRAGQSRANGGGGDDPCETAEKEGEGRRKKRTFFQSSGFAGLERDKERKGRKEVIDGILGLGTVVHGTNGNINGNGRMGGNGVTVLNGIGIAGVPVSATTGGGGAGGDWGFSRAGSPMSVA